MTVKLRDYLGLIKYLFRALRPTYFDQHIAFLILKCQNGNGKQEKNLYAG